MTEQQRTVAVDALALEELREAYRAWQEAQAEVATRATACATVTAETGQEERVVLSRAWSTAFVRSHDAKMAFQRAAEAFCAGLGEQEPTEGQPKH